jgi:hypothetical protein
MSFANKVNRQLQAASKRQDEVEEKVDNNIKETKQNSEEIEKLRAELNRMKTTLESEREERSNMLGEELRDRETRRNNLVIHGLQENETSSIARERMESDRQLCGELLATIGARTRAADLRFCRRVGERGREARPIVIGLRSEQEKRYILDRAADLRNTRFSNVSICPDMTRMQRRAEDQLAKEAETRNNQLTTEDRDKNLRWMVVGRRGEKRLIKGTEREQQNYGRREAQLGDFISGAVGGTGQRTGYETGARRKEYYPQRPAAATAVSGPQLLAPLQQNNSNYIPIQHNARQYNNNQFRQPNGPQQQHPGNNHSNRLSSQGNRNYNSGGGFNGPTANYGDGRGYGNGYPAGQFNGPTANYGDGRGYGNGVQNFGNNNSSNGFGSGDGRLNNSNDFFHNNSGNGMETGIQGAGNVVLTWRGGAGNNDSGYTEPHWQDQQNTGRRISGEWQGNIQQRTPARQDLPAADTRETMEGGRPRLNSKRGRDSQEQTMEEGPPRTRSRQ